MVPLLLLNSLQHEGELPHSVAAGADRMLLLPLLLVSSMLLLAPAALLGYIML
jgi:hypothetical protein